MIDYIVEVVDKLVKKAGSRNTLGGYKVVGRDDEAARVLADAKAVEAAGAATLSFWKRCPRGWQGGSPRSFRSRPSASARVSTVTVRCWSLTI